MKAYSIYALPRDSRDTRSLLMQDVFYPLKSSHEPRMTYIIKNCESFIVSLNVHQTYKAVIFHSDDREMDWFLV